MRQTTKSRPAEVAERLEPLSALLARSDEDAEAIVEVGRLLEELAPRDILAWTWNWFGPSAAASSSFQSQSVALLHMIAEVCPEMPVLFLDTGFHFPQTLCYRKLLQERLGLRLVDLHRRGGHPPQAPGQGALYHHDPDLCCYIHKVEPLQQALRGVRAWVTGIRRDQTPQRSATPILARRRQGGFKICPLAGWIRRDLEEYTARHRLPLHPLTHHGYSSIGCSPCTRPANAEEGERAGRWVGKDKTECGLHLRDRATREET